MKNGIIVAMQTAGASEVVKDTQNLSLILGISALIMVFILAVLLAVVIWKLNTLTAKYNLFMKGSNGSDLESSIVSKYKEIDEMKTELEFVSSKLNIACDTLLNSYQKMSLVKYDAFKEMGGKLSFSLALLDDKNSGFILSSVHTSDGCYTYAKEIIKGESYVVLSNEERNALEEAKSKKDFLV